MQIFLWSILFIHSACAFFGHKFRIETREIRSPIIKTQDPLFNGITGFYGIIGPDVDVKSITSLYELFTGDGMIQGVFFDKGKMTFVKHFIRTEKLLYESDHGRFSKNVCMTPLYVLLNKLGCLPNTLGLANTAFLQIENKVFALFERDYPYQINIDVESQLLYTIKKKIIPNVAHFSGHSKYDGQMIHTIDYDVVQNRLIYVRLNSSFRQISKSVIKTHYIPLIHDFIVLSNNTNTNNSKMIFVDSPFVWNIPSPSPWTTPSPSPSPSPWTTPLPSPWTTPSPSPWTSPWTSPPVKFDRKKPTYITLYDTSTNRRKEWLSPESFYMFHCAYFEEKGENIDIYAPLYDDVEFSSLGIQGKYRRVTLHPSGKVTISKNAALERQNLDFPVKYGKYIILRNVENQSITGFVVCKGLTIVKRIRLKQNRFFCGEPTIIELGETKTPYLLGLSYDDKGMGYVSLIGVFNEDYRELELEERVQIGFHSIYLSSSDSS